MINMLPEVLLTYCRRLFFILALLPLSSQLLAISKSEQQGFSKLLASQNNFQTAYHQTIYTANGDIYESSDGFFYLGKNKVFRNDETTPDSVSIISNGKKLWVIDNDLEQVSINKLDDYLNNSPLALLLDKPENALQHFEIEKIVNNTNEEIQYRLKQKDRYSAFPDIRLGFLNKQIIYLEIDEASGKKVRIDFKNIEKLSKKDVFQAIYPDSYDVVDDSK